MSGPDALLIDLGDLASITLLSLQPDPGKLVLWHTRTSNARLEAVRFHAEICGKSRLIVSGPVPPPIDSEESLGSRAGVEGLLRACEVARHLNCCRVLWPVSVGEDHVRIAEVLERAAVVAGLADPSGSLLIDAPIVDLDDSQLVELAKETGAPMRAFQPCELDQERPCGACTECRRWREAFAQAGVDWPWAEVEAFAA